MEEVGGRKKEEGYALPKRNTRLRVRQAKVQKKKGAVDGEQAALWANK